MPSRSPMSPRWRSEGPPGARPALHAHRADAMFALGLLVREGDTYANGAAADAFLSGRPGPDLRPFLRFWDHVSYPAWLHLEPALWENRSAAGYLTGELTPEQTRIFAEGVEAFSAGSAHALAAQYDFSRHQAVLDLGGGTGSFLVAIRRRYPAVGATLYELPANVAVARTRLAANGAAGAIQVVEGDFFADPLPAGHDALLIANVFHLYSPERNKALLRRARAAVAPGACAADRRAEG